MQSIHPLFINFSLKSAQLKEETKILAIMNITKTSVKYSVIAQSIPF